MKKAILFTVLLLPICLASPLQSWAGEFGPPQKPGQPIITPTGGCYGVNEPVTVGIRAEPGCSIIYTLNGDYPAPGRGIQVDNSVASFPLPPGDTTVRAIAVRPGLPASSSVKAVFTRSGGG